MKLQQKHSHFLLEAIRFLFILLFVYAAVSKLLDYENFRVQLGQSPLLTAFAPWVAWGVPGSEIVIAGMLFIPRLRVAGLYAAFALMVMFTTYIIIILNFTDFIPCSCGGVLEKLGWTEHLLFNLVFVGLAGVGVFLVKGQERNSLEKKEMGRASLVQNPKFRNVLINISIIGSSGVLLVFILYVLSEGLIHDNNNFIRIFPPHVIKETGRLELPYNSYYIAGTADKNIYLANGTALLHLLKTDSSLRSSQVLSIKLDNPETYPFKAPRINIQKNKIYLTDGTIPVIFTGELDSLKLKNHSFSKVYFDLLEPISDNFLVIRSIASNLKMNTLGIVNLDNQKVAYFPKLLTKQVDGIFCTDGSLHYNPFMDQLVYVYYYRNQFLSMNLDMELMRTGTTIDTNTIAKIKASKNTNTLQEMTAPAIAINKYAGSWKNWLFINSSLLSSNEDKKSFEKAAVIDVYNLFSGEYKFSFYIADYDGQRLRDFRIVDNKMLVLYPAALVAYEIGEDYFIQTN